MGTDPLDIPGNPGSRERPPRASVRLWLELVVAVALTVLLALLGIGFLDNALAAHHHGSRAGQAVGAAICLGLVVACTRWAIHIEHRLRRHQPVAQAFGHVDEAAPGAVVARRPIRLGRRRRRRYGPVGSSVILALFVAGLIGVIAGAISSHSQALRSSYVQHHGIPVTATVLSVQNTEHCSSRGGCSYTAAIPVGLPSAVQGASTSVVHYPGYSDLLGGEHVAVLVDPRQLDYAELPGSAFESSWAWLLLVGLAVFLAFLVVVQALSMRRLLAHRRGHAALAGGS